MAILIRHLGGADGVEIAFVEIFRRHGTLVAALESRVFLSRDEYRALAPVLGDRDRLGQGDILIVAEIAVKFRGADLNWFHRYNPDFPDYAHISNFAALGQPLTPNPGRIISRTTLWHSP
jgi:hypothetical protein